MHSSSKIYPALVHPERQSALTQQQYQSMYRKSVEDNEGFWREHGQRLDWITPYSEVKDVSFAEQDLHIRWYADGELNVCVNCVDRHLEQYAQQTAIIWEADEPGQSRHISYQQLYEEVGRFANSLKELGVNKGDRVTIYMPMIPEAAYAMLACARIGAVHSVVFAGFSPEALAGRIIDCQSSVVITADEGRRGAKRIALKHNVDAAAQKPGVSEHLEQVLVIRHTGADINWEPQRDRDYQLISEQLSSECPPELMNAEDPLFILYTSGSTGTPKGVLHSSAGYLVYASMTHQYLFDYQRGDVYWCTADVGWITGHSYIIYGPLANGATTLMFEGVPSYPDYSRCWQICDTHQVNIFYTAPTAIRALMREGDHLVTATSRQSLRVLGTVGEPINPQAWEWYYRVVGEQRCTIIDTWWQTETGGAMIAPLPGATALKPGSASLPLFGIQPKLLDAQGQVLEGEAEGNLVIADSWPGQMRTVFGDHQRFIDTYFSEFPGYYFSGDGAQRDRDGYYWITGRMDDVLNVSGHRLGTAEVESAIVAHPKVAEAAVVGFPHEIKGQGLYIYVALNNGVTADQALDQILKQLVREQIGAIATPDYIQVVGDLPKTRSGKIMRRILRKIAADDFAELGDISTLADPAVVPALIDGRLNR